MTTPKAPASFRLHCKSVAVRGRKQANCATSAHIGGGASHGAAPPFGVPNKGRIMATIKAGDTVRVRNRRDEAGNPKEGEVIEVRASEEPAPTLVAVRLSTGPEWVSADECTVVPPAPTPAPMRNTPNM